MPPAIIAAGIGAVATVGGAVMASKAQKSAANKAAATAKDTAATNNALTQKIYGENKAALSPFQQRGNAAGDAINALLGLPGQPQPQPQQQYQQQPSFNGIDGMRLGRMSNLGGEMMGPNNFSAMQYGQPQQSVQGTVNAPAPDYNQAFQNYQNSTGYQFRMGEGVRALDAAASAGGVRNSGAAQKALLKYGQNVGSGEFSNYLAQLANQQAVGLSGASAQAGVGQNYVNAVSANNNSAGTAAANAQLYRGQANANMYGQIGSAIGGVASSFGGGGGINSSITSMFNKNPGIF